MNGFGHLPSKSNQNTFVFYANASGSISGSFQAWSVPEHASILHFTVIGGAGGGGGGCGGAAIASGRQGGGGGAAGGLVTATIPAFLLPKTLYLQVGFGGAPGTGSNNQAITAQNASAGTISYVCLYPEINSGSIILQSSITAPGGGVGGGVGNGTAGAAITIDDNANNLKWLGIRSGVTTPTAATNAGATGGLISSYAGLLIGGTGGGAKPANANGTNGGAINAITIPNSFATSSLPGGTGSAATNGVNGSNGFFNWAPFVATAGTGGGGTSGLGTGGNGGQGAFGCGGGGGGASRGVGGTGGRGGDGLIIITIG